MGMSGSLYKLMYLLHLGAVIVGFGSAVVGSFLGARARDLPPGEAMVAAKLASQVSRALTNGPVIAAGIFGLLLVVLSDGAYTFAQTWISVAFLLYFAVVGVLMFLIRPNARAMESLGASLASSGAPKAGGPPKEVGELAERGKKAAMYTGIVHLLWILLMLDMIWKPGV
jgi:hypothetical protein